MGICRLCRLRCLLIYVAEWNVYLLVYKEGGGCSDLAYVVLMREVESVSYLCIGKTAVSGHIFWEACFLCV